MTCCITSSSSYASGKQALVYYMREYVLLMWVRHWGSFKIYPHIYINTSSREATKEQKGGAAPLFKIYLVMPCITEIENVSV